MTSSKQRKKGRSRRPRPRSTSSSSPERVRAKSKAAANDRYKHFLQASLSCVSTTQWFVGPRPKGKQGEHALFTAESPVTLSRSSAHIYLDAGQHFRYEQDERYAGDWKVVTLGYTYTLAGDPELDSDYVSWHWHPETRPDPHMHVRGKRFGFTQFGKKHLPTGRVPFEQIIRLAIDDLGVTPTRDDWEDVLADCEKRFVKFKRW